ncbi:MULTISPECIES: carboxymuconolactone decarboxylase family protein [unclassified Paenibacillus]|uniref:carboxymuconolactone decarboxylase family protein n=1 Tax=unclassified Paenibacillus TaxID=185978 RepID=UPI00095614A6|nr:MULTISPECIES: carboxymuconolactone decarboxylase family protein [unclassified Paenibacillus]ASS67247.1 carboxymuconolactone decarboxylase family protein [Paenibacillus sp. RUD330]SIQ84275.1 alkylhydroperoxidase AhpD family core domain-containing protein [Paenibacillus sp. RU4X]SIR05141.1 alkylhydroperoxidase AhpD family core domain-containing protein [Paenibacillus sp. RU4T]
MKLRMNYYKSVPEAYQAMAALEKASGKSLDPVLKELVKIRVSQINGCAFCIDMHVRDLLKLGGQNDRMPLISVWHDAPCFSDAERAALRLAEHAAVVSVKGIPEEVYEEARRHFDEKQFMDLILVVNAISGWNRISIATGMFPGCFS